jgi:hypothetical protein
MIGEIPVRPVLARLEPGDQIAAIVKDHDGKVIGYIARSDVDAIPSAAKVREYLVKFEQLQQRIAETAEAPA